jgi:hypothetical protein
MSLTNKHISIDIVVCNIDGAIITESHVQPVAIAQMLDDDIESVISEDAQMAEKKCQGRFESAFMLIILLILFSFPIIAVISDHGIMSDFTAQMILIGAVGFITLIFICTMIIYPAFICARRAKK